MAFGFFFNFHFKNGFIFGEMQKKYERSILMLGLGIYLHMLSSKHASMVWTMDLNQEKQIIEQFTSFTEAGEILIFLGRIQKS